MRGRNRPMTFPEDDDEADIPRPSVKRGLSTQQLTLEELRQEEAGIKELEQKKRSLEQRVIGMDKDLGGLLR